MLNPSELFQFIPKWLRATIALILLIVFVVYTISLALPNLKFIEKQESCDKLMLRGRILDEKTLLPISRLKIYIDLGSSLVSSETTSQGTFLLEGVVRPKSNTIRLIIIDHMHTNKSQHIDLDLTSSKHYDETNCNLDLGTLYLTFKETNSAPTIPKTSSKTKFQLIPFNRNLIDFIEKSDKLIFDQKATLKVEVTCTNSIKLNTESNLYYYEGGVVSIIVNGLLCTNLENLVIPSTPRIGNSFAKVKAKIDSIIEYHVTNSSLQIAQAINNCQK